MQQLEIIERMKAALNTLRDAERSLSAAQAGLVNSGMTPRNAKSICMIYVKEAFKNNQGTQTAQREKLKSERAIT